MHEDSTTPSLRVDLVSDVVCPWCIVGYRQLQQALSEVEQAGEPVHVDLRWHPFQLNPEMPAEGQDLHEHLTEKYGTSTAQNEQNRAHLQILGKDLDIEFSFAPGMRIHNTFNSHLLLHWAAECGRQTELKLALFRGYFTQAENPNDVSFLLRAAESVGLDKDEASAILREQRYAREVTEIARSWVARGIQGVPAFVFNQQHLVSGAQGKEVFVRAVQQLLA